MSQPSPQLCLEASVLASNSSLKWLYIFRLLMSSLGVFLVLKLYYKKGSSWLVNPNAKILYQAHVYFSLHISLFFTLLYGYQLYRSFVVSLDPCFFVLEARTSCLIRLTPGLGIHFQTFNMFTFAIERAISTLFSQQYEKINNSLIGFFLLFISLIIVLCMNLICIYLPIKQKEYVSLLTAKNAQNASTYQLINNIPWVVEFSTLILFSLIYYYNSRKAKGLELKKSTLGNRYQIQENKKIIRTLLPCFIVHCLLNMFSYGGISLYPLFYPNFDLVRSTIWIEIISQAQTYSIVLPIIVLCLTRRSRQVHSINPETATDIYFRQLNELFDKT